MSFLINTVNIIKEELRILEEEIMIQTGEGNRGYYLNDLKVLEEDLFQNPIDKTLEKEWDFQKEIEAMIIETKASLKVKLLQEDILRKKENELRKEMDDLIVKLDNLKI